MIANAQKYIGDILSECFKHSNEQKCIVVFDLQSELSKVLTAAYREAVPSATFINFDEATPENILARFAELKPADLVVLIQSTNFRLEAFRIRIELFKRQIKVIEHPHLGRMTTEQNTFYIDSLAYDASYFRGVGDALKSKIDHSTLCTVDTGGDLLIYSSKLESAKLNVGDYSSMTNIGGQFPIGEVFTEATDLTAVNGRAKVFCFGDTTYTVNKPASPITIIVEHGIITSTENSTPEFENVLNIIRTNDGEVQIRELGFGMNRAFTREKVVNDIGTYERMCGVHLSMGKKHDSFVKPGFKRGESRFHIDVFLAVESVNINGEIIFQNNEWKATIS